MSATERYLSALEHEESDSKLDSLLGRVEAEDGALAAIRCLEQRVQRANGNEGELRQAVVDLCDRVAREAGGEVALEAALRAVSWRDEEAEDTRDAVLRALLLTVHNPNDLKRATDATGGGEGARETLKAALKDPAVKQDPERSAELRRLLGKLYDLEGDTDRAFFELLKALRKAPGEAVYLDEVFQLALAAERFEEGTVVFEELSADESLEAKIRATYCNKLAHLLERGLGRPEDALQAYERSLVLHPGSKGARRHRDRLSEQLGILTRSQQLEQIAPVDDEQDADDLVIDSAETDAPPGPPGPPPLEDELPPHLPGGPDVTAPAVHLDSLVATAEAPRPSSDLETAEAPIPGDTAEPPPLSEIFGEGAKLEQSGMIDAFGGDTPPPDAPSPFDGMGLGPPQGVDEEPDEPETTAKDQAQQTEPVNPTQSAAAEDESEPDDEPHATGVVPMMETQEPPAEDFLPAATVEGGPQDVFEQAGTLLGGDDLRGCIECAEAMLARDDRGSMALRLAGHALHLAADTGEPMPARAAAVFEHELDSDPAVAYARALEVLEATEDPTSYEPLFLLVAERTEDAAKVRSLLEPVARFVGPPSASMKVLDARLEDDLEARLEIRKEAAQADPLQARYWLEDSAELLDDAGEAARAREIWAELALNLASDDEKIRARARQAHADDPEAERNFLTAMVATLPRARVRGVREELARALLVDGELDQAEAHGRTLADDPYARGPGFAILGAVMDARGDGEGAMALALERLEVAYDDGQPGDDELRALAERYLARDDEDALVELVRDHAAREVGDLSSVAELATLLEAREREVSATQLLLTAAGAGGGKEIKRAWLERALQLALAAGDRELANETCGLLLDVDPDHVEGTLARAELALELGDARAAINPLERLVARTEDPHEKSRLHLQIGTLLDEELEDPEGAAKRYQAATDASPGNVAAWRARVAHAERAKDDEAEATALDGLLRAVDDDEPELAALHRAHAGALARCGRHPDAERAYKAALVVEPTDTEALEAWFASLCKRLDDAELEVELQPSDALLTVLREQLDPAWSLEGATEAARRLGLLARARSEAPLEELFRPLLDARPDDIVLLRAYAGWLAKQPEDEASLARRGETLEALLKLEDEPGELARLGGELALVRRAADDDAGALAALHDAVAASLSSGEVDAMAERALDAALQLLASGEVSDPSLRVDALELKGRRLDPEKGAMFLEEGARIARERAEDPDRARSLLNLAIERAPQRAESRQALLELELETGRGEEAIATTEGMLKNERDPEKRAELHVRTAEMIQRVREDEAATLEHLQAALKESPKNPRALAAAEAFYQESGDPRGLAALYSSLLGRLDREDREGRALILDRLAQVRRYDLRDLDGALEALEAIAALDHNTIKPREDAARILTELGKHEDAASAWRHVLERDPLSADGWRALLSNLCRARRGDEAFAVAQTIVSVELGDRELERAVRQLRPPFPRWPRAADDPGRFKRELSHPLEKTPIRTVFDVVGSPVHAAFAKPLKEFGFRKKDRLSERNVPPSLLLAVRTVTQMLGLQGIPPLYRGERASDLTPAFALLPATEPGIVIADDALRGGMTPERAFALGRAMACLMPHALPVSTLDAPRIKDVLEALTARFVPAADGSGTHSQVHELGQRLDLAIFRGQPPQAAGRVRGALETALRDYQHAAQHLHISDWMAGVGYTGDRLGFLLVGDLAPCVRVIKQGAPKERAVGARLATRELVLFSASTPYLHLRQELGLALPPNIAAPILELG